MRAVHVALEVETDDRHFVKTFGHDRRLADDLANVMSLSGLVEPFGHLRTVVGHDAGIRPDPPYAARQVFGDEGGLRPKG